MLVLTQSGERLMLDKYFNGSQLYMRLFTNNVIPERGSDTFREASGGGYAPRLLGEEWELVNDNGLTKALYPEQEFRFTGPLKDDATIYGCFVTDGTEVLFAERAQASFIPRNNGDTYSVSVSFQLLGS